MVNPTGPAMPIWMGGTGTYVDRLTVREKRVIRGGSWIAPEGTVRATHRFWNHPLNNSYGVGLGFRCAKTSPPEIEQQIRDCYIAALVEMGRERLMDSQQAISRGLAIDPKNLELLELQLADRTDNEDRGEGMLKRSFSMVVVSHRGDLDEYTTRFVLDGIVFIALWEVLAASGWSHRSGPASHPESAQAVHEAEHDVDQAWEVYHRAALGGTVASPALQADIEQHLHEARTLVSQAQEAAEAGRKASGASVL